MKLKDRKFDSFDQFAEDYATIHNENIKISGATSDYFCRERVSKIYEHEKDNIRSKILDFGCGDGSTEIYFREIFPEARLFGVDPSPASIEVAKKRKIKDTQFQSFDGESIPYDDGEFDIILVANVFHHINFKYHGKIIKEIYRVLKKGGRVYIFEHNPFNPLTRKIVQTCVFDDDAELLKSSYLKNELGKAKFANIVINFFIFFPRSRVFAPVIPFEKWLAKIPLGGKYYVCANK